MHKDHSNEDFYISQKPFVSVKNILRVNAQKNIIDGRTTWGVTLVLDNQGTKDLEEATGNSIYPKIAIVMANRLLYVVENSSKIKTGIMQIILIDYNQNEVDEMVNAISNKN
jgi:preprotein translocase subunit SecD